MLRRISVYDVQRGKICRANGRRLLVAMRFYPRFLRRELVDEYQRSLAPPAELFKEFKERERELANHNLAFDQVRYEQRFDLSAEGREVLRRLAEDANDREILLVCQCRDFDRCHCDLLLLWARERFAAPVSGLLFEYPGFLARLESPSSFAEEFSA